MEVILACLLMGLGIGMDVALATFVRGRVIKQKRAMLLWLIGISLTHTLFPMIGYAIALFSIKLLPWLTPLVGIVAFILIAYFIKQELTSNEEEAPQLMVNLALILAVSWDALWSGPAKSAQVVGWSDFWIIFSFFIVGLLVLFFALTSLWLANRIPENAMASSVLPFDLGQWLQLSIISYFGLLALIRYTLNLEVQDWQILVLSFCLMAICLCYKTKNELGSLNTKLPLTAR